jgi:hypothetical protein
VPEAAYVDYGRITDSILFYAKTDRSVFTPPFMPYDETYLARDYRRVDDSGRRYRLDNIQGPGGEAKGNPYYEVMGVSRYWRYSKDRMADLIRQGRIVQTSPGAVPQYKRYLDEMPGVPAQNLWDDVSVINNRSSEYLGYPTQSLSPCSNALSALLRMRGMSCSTRFAVAERQCIQRKNSAGSGWASTLLTWP